MPQKEESLFLPWLNHGNFIHNRLLNDIHVTVEPKGEVLLFVSRQNSSLNILQVYACKVYPAKTFKTNLQSIEIQILKCFVLRHT